MRKLIYLLLLLSASSFLWSENSVLLKEEKAEYQLGDLIEVDVRLDALSEFNHIFFDVDYNEEVLDWVEYKTTALSHKDICRTLFARAVSRDNKTGRLIFSLNWKENRQVYNETPVITLVFRAKRSHEGTVFTFNNRDIKNLAGGTVASEWKNSAPVTISGSSHESYIWINNPQDASVLSDLRGVSDGKADFSLIFTKSSGVSVQLKNDTNGASSEVFYEALGFKEGIPLPLAEGKNTVTAFLYDKEGTVLALESINVHYVNSENSLRVLSPFQSSVVNQNRIPVKVASDFSNVVINSVKAEPMGYTDNNQEVYTRDVWLSPGFNTVEITATSDKNEVYQRELSVYFEKSDEVFRISRPLNGKIVKYEENSSLWFTGEISQKFADNGQENSVVYDVLFYPQGYREKVRTVIKEGMAEIKEASAGGISTETAYTFTNVNPIPLKNLKAGTLEIIAYKNKRGTAFDESSAVYVVLDNSRLSIQLEQPRVYSDDLLLNEKVLDDFQKLAYPKYEKQFHNVSLHPSGSLSLDRTDYTVSGATPFTSARQGLTELSNGTLLWYTNKNGIARFKSRKLGREEWTDYYPDTNEFYIYDVEETDKGLLLGVSNYSLSGKTGLYLLHEGKLTNIVLGKPVTHVQFIQKDGDIIYLYGNDYSHIYSFNINTLEPYGDRLKTSSVESIPLANSLAIKDFHLSPSQNTAALLTLNGDLHFYSLRNGSFVKKKFIDNSRFTNVKNVYPGNYDKGAYFAWVIEKEAELFTVMEKKADGVLTDYSVKEGIPAGEVLGIASRGDEYYILTHDTGKNIITQGKFFFNRFIENNPGVSYTGAGVLTGSDSDLIVTEYNGLFWGDGVTKNLYNFTSNIQREGSAEFSYYNPHAEGIKGFTFDIPGKWVDNPSLTFDFNYQGTEGFSSAGYSDPSKVMTVRTWHEANQDSEKWKAYLGYNTSREVYELDVEFAKTMPVEILDFVFRLQASGTATPSVENIRIRKKVPVKVPTPDSTYVEVPVKGRVTDPTVRSLLVENKEVFTDASGSFRTTVEINSSRGEDVINLTCVNVLGDTATESFKVQLFESVNDLGTVSFFDSKDSTVPVVFDADNEKAVNNETVWVSFEYYGLKGAITGYEVLSIDEKYIIKQGLFASETDAVFNSSLFYGDINNLESGSVVLNPVTLQPGGQKIRVFVENPGGKREYFYLNSRKDLPVFVYNMDKNLEGIKLITPGNRSLPESSFFYSDTDVSQEFSVSISETKTEPYAFSRRISLKGNVESLHTLSHVKLKSSSEDVLFSNGLQEIIVEVDELNNFSFDLSLLMKESSPLNEEHFIVMQPTAPYLIHLKSVFRLNLEKDFKGAYIIPDFSSMEDNGLTSKWEDDERSSLSKPLKLRFTRKLPVGARLKLVVNFNTVIDGILVPLSGTVYHTLVDDNFKPLNLTGVKFGRNRVRWDLYYNTDNDIISSSTMNHPDMRDFIFDLRGNVTFQDTVLNFNYEPGNYYNDQNLPPMGYLKDITTTLTLLVNEREASSVSAGTEGEMTIPAELLYEGKNTIRVKAQSAMKGEINSEYSFLYDSLEPQLGKTIVSIDQGNNITSISTLVYEPNIKSVKLYDNYFDLEGNSDPGLKNLVNRDAKVTPINNSYYRVEWNNLETLDPPLNPLLTRRKLCILVEDFAGRTSLENYFTGPKLVNPDAGGEFYPLIPSQVSSENDAFYAGNPTANYRKFINDDLNRWVLYDNTVTITEQEFINKHMLNPAEDFIIERPGLINFKGVKLTDEFTGTLVVNLDSDSTASGEYTRATFESGFSFPVGKSLVINTGAPEIFRSPTPRGRYPRSFEEISFSFPFIFDETQAFFDETPAEPEASVKRILTIARDDKGKEFSVGYIRRGSLNDIVLVIDDNQSGPVLLPLYLGAPSDVLHNFLINIMDRSDRKYFRFYFNDLDPVEYNLMSYTLPKNFLAEGSFFHIGEPKDVNGLSDNNGHFSLSQFFMVDKIIASGEVLYYEDKLAEAFPGYKKPTNIADYSYSFSMNASDIPLDKGLKAYNLRTDKANFSRKEDVEYKTDGSALIGAGNKRNFLSKTSEDIIFHDCETSVTSSTVSYSLDAEFLHINVAEGQSGRYTFGNKPSNHGLKNDRYYTFSGSVFRTGQGTGDLDAELVLLFNNKKTVYPLIEGEFQFIFENFDREVPESVVLYLETRENLKLSSDFQFVEGNALLGEEVFSSTSSYASTMFAFNSSGTVEMFYKPFNTNIFGYADYEKVLFHSDLITIYTRDNIGKVCYSAKIGDTVLDTNVPVMEGWHHLMIAYSADENKARFYINGKVAAFSDTFVFNGIPSPQTDNVFLGGNPAAQIFADGYIDNVKLRNFCEPPYDAGLGSPLSLAYTDEKDLPEGQKGDKVRLDVTQTGGGSSTWETRLYKILSRNKNSAPLAGSFTSAEGKTLYLDSTVPPGLYFARLKGEVNGKRASSLIQFVRDDKPSFKIVDAPSLIVPQVKKELEFSVVYDNTYLPEDKNNRYAALALSLRNETGDMSEVLYLCQDYLSQNRDQWLYRYDGELSWTPITQNNNLFYLYSKNKDWTQKVFYSIDTFYFDNDFSTVATETLDFSLEQGEIPVAALTEAEKSSESFTDVNGNLKLYEYMLNLSLAGAVEGVPFTAIEEFAVKYTVGGHESNSQTVEFSHDGFLKLYYDDLFAGLGFGNYDVYLELIYKGSSYQHFKESVKWERVEPGVIQVEKARTLKINSLDLLHKQLKEGKSYGDFYLSYTASRNTSDNKDISLYYKVRVYEVINGERELLYELAEELIRDKFILLNDILLGTGDTVIEVDLYEKVTEKGVTTEGLKDSSSASVNTRSEAPEIILTNSVPYYVSYDSMSFTWKGLIGGKDNSDIQYLYNFDEQGWNTPSTRWKELELYNLTEGFHQLRVKAVYQGQESTEAVARFFVDVKPPAVDTELITWETIYDDNGVALGVRFSGASGAVLDPSLDLFYINDRSVSVNGVGEFHTDTFDLPLEGENIYQFSAIDRVGNRTEKEIVIDNSFIEILSPSGSTVSYAPLTLVGKLADSVTQDVKIYLQDPLYQDVWHQGRVNSDRIFFIDDIAINPGNQFRNAVTTLRLKFEFSLGKVFYRDIELQAGTLLRPLEVNLSKQALQGAGEPMEVVIRAACRLDNIASWSVDFDGDGIYDDIRVTDTGKEQNQEWTHSYSTLGEIQPRVRVITRKGEYFTQSASLIIHEQIKASSGTKILEPVSMSLAHLPDNSEKAFVLRGTGESASVDVYSIGRNLNYLSNRLYSCDLTGIIEGIPSHIKSLGEQGFIITTEKGSKGVLYHFVMNEFGNYVVESQSELESPAASLALSEKYLFMTLKGSSVLHRYPRDGFHIDLKTAELFPLKLPVSGKFLEPGSSVAYVNGSLQIADRASQRIVEFSENIVPLSYWGGYGHDDKEFIQPSILTGYGSRLFVYDKSREDIQIFDSEGRIVSSLGKEGDYFEADYFNDFAAMEALGREEGGRLYYYLVTLSSSAGKLSLIRLPQWDEMRAKTRNNKIVFLQDREVYTAKPDGSDLKKVLSTDSLPRIEGVVDYPTLSPDGRRLTFVSRKKIYTGGNEKATGDNWSYDNLYILNIGDERPVKIPLNGIEGFEIERPVFNSNGDTIAFSARTNGGFWQIYEYNWNDGTVSRLFESLENLRFPYYSPDDRFLVYTTDYDGDQDLEIFDKENPDVRIEVTANNFRDSFPVWSRVYPFEVSNQELKITSKIAFVSDRDYKKGIHYAYIARPSENDLRVVTTGGENVGSTPDIAAVAVARDETEGDYPAYTGDGENLVYEEYDGESQTLVKWKQSDNSYTTMNLPEGSQKPSGMRNTITAFKAEIQNGNEVRLSWTPYTDHNTFYLLQYKKASEGEQYTQKKIYSQNGTVVSGLEMNTDYLMHVVIKENEQVVAETQWLKVEIPEVVARPVCEVDSDNPYLVKLHAWKPEKETQWTFSWIIDNQEITTAQSAQDLHYEFATSGEKTIQLKATNREGSFTNISSPLTINIVSDIEPIIESVLITGDKNYLELDASNSVGSRIDMSSALWTITGPGVPQPLTFTGSRVIADVSSFLHKVNVNLKLSRHMVQGQNSTDTIEINKVIDLDYSDVKPIVTWSASEDNERLILFDGTSSFGNIDWRTARWSLYGDGQLIHREDGVSSFSFLFPESTRPVPYAVTLTVGDMASGLTKTASHSVSVDPAELVPVVDYEILTLKEGGQDVGTKVILSAAQSRGSNIDFNLTEWNLPVAAQLGEQPKQKGPTAIFNLRNPGDMSQIEVSITLMRRGGLDMVTETKRINIDSQGVSETEIFVNKEISETSEGYVVTLDVLQSTGPDIDWKNTEWLINNQYAFKGPVARVDKTYMGEEQTFNYSVVLHRFGSDPIYTSGLVPLNSYKIIPSITEESAGGNSMRLSVQDTDGLNIDWSRTLWSIWDGNEDVVQKRGATVLHSFVPRQEAMGYPVMVEMYLKNDDTPFYGYKSVQIEGDEILPVIQWDEELDEFGDEGDVQVVTFSALSSTGSGIDWSQTKWNFGDGSPAVYGATAQHKYPTDGSDRKYKVALTLSRRNRNGNNESKTVYKTIEIGAEEITPVIKARLDLESNTLILTAEASEGRGLLLDRSVWMFAGKGDSENFSRSKSHVRTENNSQSQTENSSSTDSTNTTKSTNKSNTKSHKFGVSANVKFGIGPVDASIGSSYDFTNSNTTGSSSSETNGSSNTSSSGTSNSQSSGTSDNEGNNQSYSTQNTHTGAICRRYIADFDFNSFSGNTNANTELWVTLFVYRINSDGSTSGTSFTERINLLEVKEAGLVGKEYK